jgi:hypothetical protein
MLIPMVFKAYQNWTKCRTIPDYFTKLEYTYLNPEKIIIIILSPMMNGEYPNKSSSMLQD